MPGSEGGGSSASTSSGSDAPGTGAEAGDRASSEPGFGDMAGGADLPSMVDTLPTFEARIHEAEHALIVRAVAQALTDLGVAA